MSDIIQVLPDSVANQIAAGEVIQRPASVIKELVENAVDAGADTINVVVVDAGRTSIQVIDNGKGMSETDARLSFERHATSKIRKADDLFDLHTMGFRGEALASIAAVAQVTLKTRMATDEIGTQINISGGKVLSQVPVSCPVGCNFSVENLFYNVPARRKFLKSNTTELNNILQAFERIVLVNPGIHFTLHSNGVEVFNLRASNLRQRIVDIFGKRFNQDILPVDVETTVCKITGFVGKPESSKKKGAHQYLFANGRYMKHPYFHKAVQGAFERLIPVGEQVPYFIYLEVNPENIDVNIHPTKTEIKFEDEQTIWQILIAAVKEAIGKFNDVPSIEFDTQGKPDIPVFNPTAPDVTVPKVDYDPQYNPFKPTSRSSSFKTSVPSEWTELYAGMQHPQKEQNLFGETQESSEDDIMTSTSIIEEKSPVHYQYKGQYIMTAVKSGLMIIDQHRAHVRILYEGYLRQMEEKKGNSQKLLFPEVVQLAPSDSVILDNLMTEMERVGFDLSDLGNGSYAINGIPAELEGVDMNVLLHQVVASAKESSAKIGDDIYQSLALCLAQHAAIPYGQILGNDEMDNLVNTLFGCSNVNYTPDGKVIICILKQKEIDQLMG
jgi:DNA mismatch repair protein MutL